MKFVYKPVGSDESVHRSWDFEPNKIMSPEAIAIEKLTGMTFGQWIDAFGKGSMTAIHAYLYVMLKRETPILKPSDVSFSFDDFDFDLSDAELREQLEDLDPHSEDDAPLIAKIKAALGDDPSEDEGDPKD